VRNQENSRSLEKRRSIRRRAYGSVDRFSRWYLAIASQIIEAAHHKKAEGTCAMARKIKLPVIENTADKAFKRVSVILELIRAYTL
jgi:hypothetical protein